MESYWDSLFLNSATLYVWTHLTTFVLFTAPLALLYAVFRALCIPNKSEKRIHYFTDLFVVNPMLGHCGGYPENTLTGIRLSKKRGLKVVEVDVEYTRDGHAVLLHDPKVDRTSNGTGNIRDLTFAQVRELDFGIKFGPQYAGEKIPTLQEAIALCKELDLVLFVDVKSNRLRTARLLKELCSKDKELYNHIVVVSFYPELLYLVNWADPNLVVSLAMKDWEFTWNMDGSRRHDRCWRQLCAPFYDVIVTWFNYNVIWRLMELPFVELYKGDLTDGRLEFWRKRGAKVIVWTMDEDEAKQFHKTLKLPIMVDITPP